MTNRPREPADRPHDILAAEEFVVPAPDPGLHGDGPHDVLAAEEFVVPAPDPGLHGDGPHDVLAAEEFVVPAPDPGLHGDLPHDVLAAEEFAVPAGHGGVPGGRSGGVQPGSWTAVAMRGPRADGGARAAGLLLLGAFVAGLWRRRRS
jgi:hypothetical protein